MPKMRGSRPRGHLVLVGAVVLIAGLILGPALWVAGDSARIASAPPLQTAGLRSDWTESLCPTLGPSPPCSTTFPPWSGAVYVPDGNDFVYTFTSVTSDESGIAVLSGATLHRVSEATVPCFTSSPMVTGPGPYVFLACMHLVNQTTWTVSLLAFDWTRGSVAATIPMPTAYPQNVSVAYEPARAEAFVAVAPLPGGADRLLTLSLPSFRVTQNVTIPNGGEQPFIWAVHSGEGLELAFAGNSSLLGFDPSTSSWTPGPHMGGAVQQATVDPETGRAYV